MSGGSGCVVAATLPRTPVATNSESGWHALLSACSPGDSPRDNGGLVATVPPPATPNSQLAPPPLYCSCPSACSAAVHTSTATHTAPAVPGPAPALHRPVAIAKPLGRSTSGSSVAKGKGGKGKGKARKLSKSSANSNHVSMVDPPTLHPVAAHNRRSKGKAKAVNSSSSRRGSVASAVGDGAAAQHSSDDDSGDNDEVARIFDVITMSDGGRGYRCPQPGCGKLCSRLPDCKKHHRTHGNERPFPCRKLNCTKRFKDTSTRCKHERTHETHAFPCRYCKRTYTRKDNLAAHKKQKHPDEPDVDDDDGVRLSCPAAAITAAIAADDHPATTPRKDHRPRPSAAKAALDLTAAALGGKAVSRRKSSCSAGSGPALLPLNSAAPALDGATHQWNGHPPQPQPQPQPDVDRGIVGKTGVGPAGTTQIDVAADTARHSDGGRGGAGFEADTAAAGRCEEKGASKRVRIMSPHPPG